MSKKHTLVCWACILAPVVAFAIGIAAIHYPVAVTMVMLAGLGIGWIRTLSWMADGRDWPTAVAAKGSAAALALTGSGLGLVAGLLAEGSGSADWQVASMALLCGMASGAVHQIGHRNRTTTEMAR